MMNPCLTFPSCNHIFMNLVFQSPLSDTYPGKESIDLEEDSIRIGNTLRTCRLMAASTESLCCLNGNEISELFRRYEIIPFDNM